MVVSRCVCDVSQKVKRQNFLSKYEKTLNKHPKHERKKKKKSSFKEEEKKHKRTLSTGVCVCVREPTTTHKKARANASDDRNKRRL